MKSKVIIVMMLGLVLFLQIVMIYRMTFPIEDVNKDRKVDVLDILIVKKRILKEMEGK